MAIAGSGAISFSQLAQIVYNSPTARVALNDTDVRTLLGVGSGQISVSSAYSKPTAGNTGTTYYSPGTYTWLTPAYEYLNAQVAGGGGGGGGGQGGQFWFYGCINMCYTGDGAAGSQSDFNGVVAYGGGGGPRSSSASGAAGGNNQNGDLGGGGAGGGGGGQPGGTNCNVVGGGAGGAGGWAQYTWKKNASGPAYGASITFTVGSGGAGGNGGCAPAPGGDGGSGAVYINWS